MRSSTTFVSLEQISDVVWLPKPILARHMIRLNRLSPIGLRENGLPWKVDQLSYGVRKDSDIHSSSTTCQKEKLCTVEIEVAWWLTISPYLFIFCTEVLSWLCNKAQIFGSLSCIIVARNIPQINHLLFRDNTMVFIKSDEANCKVLNHILNCKPSFLVGNFQSAWFSSLN